MINKENKSIQELYIENILSNAQKLHYKYMNLNITFNQLSLDELITSADVFATAILSSSSFSESQLDDYDLEYDDIHEWSVYLAEISHILLSKFIEIKAIIK
jgi:hypothetical protein